VAVADPAKEIADWAVKVLGASRLRAASALALFPSDPDRVEITLQPRKRPGDLVSQTVLGACAFYRSRRMPKPGQARVERMCQRIYDTTMTIACISDVALTERATTALARLARQTGALVFDGQRVHDEVGRLVIDLQGRFDVGAMAPQLAVVSSGEPIAAAAKARDGVTVTALKRGKGFRFSPAHERHLRYLGLEPRSREGQARIKELATFFKQVRPQLYLERTADDGDVLAIARTLARGRVAVINDGWAFYDPDGRVLLDRNGELDPKARWPMTD